MIRGELRSRPLTTIHRHKDGHEIPVEMNLQCVVPPGQPPRFINLVRDITERRKAERLAQRSQRLEALGTLAGGVGAPILFGWIIGTGSSTALFAGYLVAAVLMIFGAIVEAWIGVPAERRSLEHVAAPLSSKGL